jgi:hypothetical protein
MHAKELGEPWRTLAKKDGGKVAADENNFDL